MNISDILVKAMEIIGITASSFVLEMLLTAPPNVTASEIEYTLRKFSDNPKIYSDESILL